MNENRDTELMRRLRKRLGKAIGRAGRWATATLLWAALACCVVIGGGAYMKSSGMRAGASNEQADDRTRESVYQIQPDAAYRTMVVRTRDGVSALDLRSGRASRLFADRARIIAQVDLSPDGSMLAVSRAGGNGVTLHELDSGDPKTARIRLSPGGIDSKAAFSPCGKMLATASEKDVRLWDVRTGQVLRRFDAPRKRAGDLEFSSCGRFLLGTYRDRHAFLWRTDRSKPVREFPHETDVFAATFIGNSGLLTGDVTGIVTRWDIATGRIIWRKSLTRGTVQGLAASSEANAAAVSGVLEHRITIVDLRDGTTRRRLKGHTRMPRRLVFSRHGGRLYSGGFDGTVRVWDWRAGREIKTLFHSSPVADDEATATQAVER